MPISVFELLVILQYLRDLYCTPALKVYQNWDHLKIGGQNYNVLRRRCPRVRLYRLRTRRNLTASVVEAAQLGIAVAWR